MSLWPFQGRGQFFFYIFLRKFEWTLQKTCDFENLKNKDTRGSRIHNHIYSVMVPKTRSANKTYCSRKPEARELKPILPKLIFPEPFRDLTCTEYVVRVS